MIEVSRKTTVKINLTEEQLNALYHLLNKCLFESHRTESNFTLSADEYLLSGKLIDEIERTGLIKELVNT